MGVEDRGEVEEIGDGLVAHRPIELRGELAHRAALCDVELLDRPTRRLGLVAAEQCQRPSVRRPGRRRDRTRPRELPRAPGARCADGPRAGLLDERGAVRAVGEEADPLAVRGPEGAERLVPRGQAGRLAARGRDDPGAHVLVANAEPIEAPGQVGDPPGDRTCGVADDEALVAARGEHENLGAVRRPLREGRRAGKLRHPRRLAAGERQDPRRGRVVAASAHEEERTAVGRDARARVRGAVRQTLGSRAALEAHPPEPRGVLAVLDGSAPVDGEAAVGRDVDALDQDLPLDVCRADRAHSCHFPARRTGMRAASCAIPVTETSSPPNMKSMWTALRFNRSTSSGADRS